MPARSRIMNSRNRTGRPRSKRVATSRPRTRRPGGPTPGRAERSSRVVVEVRSEVASGGRQLRRLRARAAAFLSMLELRDVELSILLTDNPTIRVLNRAWRRKDRPTDVLSFPAGEPPPGPEARGTLATSSSRWTPPGSRPAHTDGPLPTSWTSTSRTGCSTSSATTTTDGPGPSAWPPWRPGSSVVPGWCPADPDARRGLGRHAPGHGFW